MIRPSARTAYGGEVATTPGTPSTPGAASNPPSAMSAESGNTSGLTPNTPMLPAAAVLSRPTTPSPTSYDKKGKRRADPGPGRPLLPSEANMALSSMLDEALSSPLDLPSSPESAGRASADRGASTSFSASPTKDVTAAGRSLSLASSALVSRPQPAQIADPPRTRYPPEHMQPALRPRLVSNLTRTTLPTSSLTYATAEDRWHDQGWRHEYRLIETCRPGEGSSTSTSAAAACAGSSPGVSSHAHMYTLSRYTDEFPDLDPETGLPEPRRRSSSGEREPDLQRLRVQRTISQLSRYSTSPEAASPVKTGPFGLPGFSIPRISGSRRSNSVDLTQTLRRTFTTSSTSRTSKKETSTGPAATWNSFWTENKKRVDSLLETEDQAASVEEEQAKMHVKYKTPQYPMVFCHGLLGFDYLGPEGVPALQISHWRGIREVLEANGVDVMIARVPATSSIKDRATILHDLIAERYRGQTVNLVAHSMGGLDCRFLISNLAPKHSCFKVASLTTISTPHRGSPFADYVIDNVIGRDRLPQLLGLMEAMRLPTSSGDGSAFAALGTRAMAEFNNEVVDDPEVKYFSWGASCDPGLLDTFRWPWSVILAKEGPNDGLVSVYSAKWGEYRGTLLDVNHLELVGWVNNLRYLFSKLTDKPFTWKPATFYLEVSDYLAQQGF